MYPPPMTNIRSGISFSSKAPVESTTRSLPILNAGGIAGMLPVARTQWSKVKVLSAGTDSSSPSNWIVVELTKDPFALITLTLRFLARPAKPPVNVLMTFSLRARTLSMAIFGEEYSTPHSSVSSSASEMTFATCRRALEGMQPRSKQVPPSFPSDSTIVTSMPSSAAKNAAA